MITRVKYPLTVEAKQAALELVSAWDADEIDQVFTISEVWGDDRVQGTILVSHYKLSTYSPPNRNVPHLFPRSPSLPNKEKTAKIDRLRANNLQVLSPCPRRSTKDIVGNTRQGGAKGQGRIKIETGEVERLKDLMRVRPCPVRQRRPPTQRQYFPGITVKLGLPDQ